MFAHLLAGLAIVLLISLIYWLFYYDNDNEKRERFRKCLNTSVGIFDEGARLALGELIRIENPVAEDHFNHGRLLQYNLLNGDLRGYGDPEPLRTHRRLAIENIVRDYTNTLATLRGGVGNNPEFIITQIEDFNNNLNITDDDIVAQIIFDFNNTVANTAPAAREEVVADRVARANDQSSSAREAANVALDDATKYTEDRQNVHESKINSDLRTTLAKLRPRENLNVPDILDEIHDRINTEKNSSALMSVFNKATAGVMVGTFNESEDVILATVWHRCQHPRNAEVRNLMFDAVITSMADCVENGSVVCVNGRCARYLNSLVTLDFDKDVADGALTFEAYRNQIFQELKDIIEREIDQAALSADVDLRDSAAAYDSGDDDSIEVFARVLRREITHSVNSYSDKLSDSERQGILSECYVYAGV